jgi:hypothetical protein
VTYHVHVFSMISDRNRNNVKTECAEPAQCLYTEIHHNVPASNTQIVR